ncbi:type I-E CRISPR-associated protein Cse1/CasA [Paucibacter sp. PLA-PC-4]|uniref:type I-E CRISPR-associated protein Cse1/CasA n=1 Tax=Paucibacter sp. PLA-PC-4 TaxID=2993655 RepID=UPI00224B3400|nr:type I-E CRISPR-associated protein Cse1/CasA [Paucibacter sp. PLA-PC-4]MCX2865657.1 type I-E CRISPR-associated protein Cse1/CasA [Paucibacter sp. PLA-PC-4]
MNLLDEPWLPVRLHDGQQQWITPQQLSDPGIVAFDACRADFNGALAQFAIGLLQTCTPVAGAGDWRALLKTPPDAATLAQWFEPHRAAFEFEGGDARFMQDFELRARDAEPNGIGGLLIETPGENAIKNNSDHFVKRGRVDGLCPHCAALALFTLQTNAPSGGAGHRTGLRGGGPLTTLLLASSSPAAPAPLWQTLWLNVLGQQAFLAGGVEPGMEAPQRSFPWLGAQAAIQKEKGDISPLQVHPAHVFWAMPRRIRLDMEATGTGTCDLCGRESQRLIRQYVTRNYGLNYKGAWLHPLSPYYEGKEGKLPLHPQPDGLGYRHWLAWVLGMHSDRRRVQAATVVSHFLLQHRIEQKTGIALRLWAFGYDMDNAKARCWYDATVPLYHLGDCGMAEQKALREDVSDWLAGAELTAGYLRGAVKDAWFSADARGDFGFIDATFWSRTEAGFYRLLRERIEDLRDSKGGDAIACTEAWRRQLRMAALQLFDTELIGAGPIERQNPARIATAHKQLSRNLDGPKLREALGLPQPVKAGAPAA